MRSTPGHMLPPGGRNEELIFPTENEYKLVNLTIYKIAAKFFLQKYSLKNTISNI